MGESKNLTDREILSNVLKELRYSANSLASELGITSASFYHILKGKNNLSDNLCRRIVARFPEVNYMYLKMGQEPILNSNPFKEKVEVNNSLSFDSVPETLKSIEKLLIKICDKLD